MADVSARWVISSLLLSLRLFPLFAFTPPFTLTRLPRSLRALMSVGLAASIAGGYPDAQLLGMLDAANVIPSAARELMLGLAMSLPLSLMYGAIYMAGRTVDIQAGYGLALLIDPTSRSQTPLVGTILAYLAGMMFFAANGQHDILRIIAASLEAAPIGVGHGLVAVAAIAEHAGVMLTLALGATGGMILALFVIDLMVAVMARAVPQMNALVIGIQVKSFALLLILPMTMGLSAAIFARMAALSLSAMARS